MSHKATTWLSEIDPQLLGHSEFRVLFHLCDCHNPSRGCYPSQAYLIEASGVSNGTLNNALNSLQSKGLIERQKIWDKVNHRQLPTRYILGFEAIRPQGPSPNSGDGKPPKPSPNSGDGAVSNLEGEPSPISGVSRLQPTGEVTCKEPVKNQGAPRTRAEIWADSVIAGHAFCANQINPAMAHEMLAKGLVSVEQLEAIGITHGRSFRKTAGEAG